MRDRTKANLISIAGMFIFFLLTPIIAHADQTTPSSLEIQRATVGIQGRVLSNNNYDVLIPIDTYYRVSFNTTGGTIINDQFIKKGSYAKEPTSPTRANYEFNYWTLNTNTPTPENEHGQSEKFNFSTTPITSNITLVAVWTPSSPSPSDENKPNNDKEDNNRSGDNNNEENNKDTSENNESIGEDKKDTTDTKDEISEDNEEDNKSNESSSDNSESKDESNRNNGESTEDSDGLSDTSEESTETTEESNDGLINAHTNPSSNHSKTSTPSIETDPDIATNTESTDLLSEIKATVLGVFKTIKTSITIVAKISLIGILIWFIWFVILLNNTLVKIQAPSEDQPDQSKRKSKSWKTIYLTPIKKTIEQTDGDKRTVWSLSLPQNLLDDNEELKVKIPWSVYHKAEDENQANQTELHITITSDQPDPTQPTMIYIITNETKEIKIK